MLAVNYRESAETIRGFLQRMPYKATILLDADGDAATDWTPRIFPSTVLIGRNGRAERDRRSAISTGRARRRAS